MGASALSGVGLGGQAYRDSRPHLRVKQEEEGYGRGASAATNLCRVHHLHLFARGCPLFGGLVARIRGLHTGAHDSVCGRVILAPNLKAWAVLREQVWILSWRHPSLFRTRITCITCSSSLSQTALAECGNGDLHGLDRPCDRRYSHSKHVVSVVLAVPEHPRTHIRQGHNYEHANMRTRVMIGHACPNITEPDSTGRQYPTIAEVEPIP